MSNRTNLQTLLENIIGSRNVYYQPPETIKINYPCIIYSRSNIVSKFANDRMYFKKNRYEIIYIDKNPDSPLINELLKLPLCGYDRHYVSDNLNHDVLTLYY